MAGRVDSRLYLRLWRATCMPWQPSALWAPPVLATPLSPETGMDPMIGAGGLGEIPERLPQPEKHNSRDENS